MLKDLQESIKAIGNTTEEFKGFEDDFAEIHQFILASLNYQNTLNNGSSEAILNIEDFVMVLRQLIDKEYILPYPLIGNWNDKVTKWEMRKGDVFVQFLDFITKRLVEEWTRFDNDKAEVLLEPIKSLLATSEQVKLNFFSLNYNLVFEKTFNSPTTTVLDNGFSRKTDDEGSVQFWSANFDHEMSSAKMNLYKLHGSIDWEYDKISESILIKDNIDDQGEPLIIFGSYSKMLSFDPFLFTLSKFRTFLEKATLFVVIGYSFHDKYINNLLIQQLSQNTDDDIPKRLLVVGPNDEDTSEADFAENLKSIQESRSINDVINFKQISPDRLKLVRMKAIDFYKDFLSNDGENLRLELAEVEKGDQPFS